MFALTTMGDYTVFYPLKETLSHNKCITTWIPIAGQQIFYEADTRILGGPEHKLSHFDIWRLENVISLRQDRLYTVQKGHRQNQIVNCSQGLRAIFLQLTHDNYAAI